jgi:hypothetical protein
MKVIESIRLFVIPAFAGMTDVKVYWRSRNDVNGTGEDFMVMAST